MAEGVFSKLDEVLQKALDERGWTPTPYSRSLKTRYHQVRIRLIVARPARKSLAAMLPLLKKYQARMARDVKLYITPLRALNRDMDRRLEEITNGWYAIGSLNTGTPHNRKEVSK